MKRRTFFIVGSGNLAAFCVEHLLTIPGFLIKGAISFDQILDNLLINKDINKLNLNSLEQFLEENEVDYLLSIVNPILLSDSIIHKIKHAAINFHDSYLPSYAGAYSTAWAIINGENAHGVTWHYMQKSFDAGDIIVQEKIFIDEKETTATLNAKCFEASKKTFEKLISFFKTENNKFPKIQQNIKERTEHYFGQAPPDFGIIDWHKDNNSIDRLCRALDFGSYTNTFGTVKVYIREQFYILHKYDLREFLHTESPGTVLCIEDFIEVATLNGSLIIYEVTSYNNVKMSCQELLNHTDIKIGSILSTIPNQLKNDLINSSKKQFNFEKSLLDKIVKSNFLQDRVSYESGNLMKRRLEIPDLNTMEREKILSILMMILSQYNLHNFIWIKFPNLCQYFHSLLPLIINFKEIETISELDVAVKKELIFLEKNAFLGLDFLKKYPTTQKYNSNYFKNKEVVIIFNKEDNDQIIDYKIKIIINKNKIEIYDKLLLPHEQPRVIDSLLNNFNIFHSNNSQKFRFEELNLLSDEDSKSIVKYNSTVNDENNYCQRLEDLFSLAVSKNENKIAVIDHEISLTFKELDIISDNIALNIKKKNLKSNIIGVYFEKSWRQIASILGILKAGFSYLPMSIDEPIYRTYLIAQKSNLAMIIADDILAENFIDYKEKLVFDFSFMSEKNKSSPSFLAKNKDYNETAYIIFTSGSTGEPKGVIIKHKNAVNTILDVIQKFDMNDSDIFFGLSKLSFDLSVFDIFGAFAVGGTLVLPNEKESKNPLHWIELIDRYKITIWNSVPALMSLLVEFIGTTNLKNTLAIKTVLLSGDWIPLNLFQKIMCEIGKETQVISLGGATEGSIWSIYYPIKQVNPLWKSIPYGYPLSNQSITILHNRLHYLMPIGFVGEISIGGLGVANGYLNEPFLSNEKFIQHPQLGNIYLTGDLGRFKSDGTVEILGRIDNQIKINGMRIETEEIEYWINQFYSLASSKILSWIQSEVSQLIAFIAINNEESLNELKLYLADKLPDYMIPKYFYYITDWPLTSNGKVDYSSLISKYHLIRVEKNATQEVIEIDSLEKQLQHILQKILLLDKLPEPRENFFEIGGDSISSLKLTNHLLKLGYSYQNQFIFRYPVISELAKHLESLNPTKVFAPKLKRVESYPLTLTQRSMLSFALQKESSDVYLEQLTIEYNGFFDFEKYKKSWQFVTDKFDILRLFLINKNFEYYQSFGANKKIEIQFIELEKFYGKNTNEKLKYFLAQDRQKNIDIYSKDLYRLLLLKTAEDNHILVFSFHHLLLDGISLSFILKAVHDNYDQKVIENSNVSFENYLQKINQTRTNQDFWTTYLSNYKPTNILPLLNKKVSLEKFSPNSTLNLTELFLNREVTSHLRSKAREYGVTSVTLLQGAWSYLLANYFNQEDVVSGLVVSGRDVFPETIGQLMVTVPFMIKVHPQDCISKYLKSIQNQIHLLETNRPIELNLFSTISDNEKFLFDHVLVFNHKLPESTLKNLEISSPKIFEKTEYPLTLTFSLGEEIHIKFSYFDDFFEAEKLQTLKNNYHNILNDICNTNDSLLSHINIWEKKENELLLAKFSKLNVLPQNFKNINLDIFKYVLQDKNKTAIICNENRKISYGELWLNTCKISHYFKNNIEPIALCLDRDENLVEAMLACLFVGKPYILIPKTIPLNRLELMCQAGNCNEILISKNSLQLKNNLKRNFSFIEISELLEKNETNEIISDKNSVAYINFTSGSSGTPKAVSINHDSLYNCLNFFKNRLELDKNDSFMSITPIGFDIAQLEIILPLYVGGTLILFDEHTISNTEKVIALANEFSPSIMQTTPSRWQLFLDAGWNYKLKHLICGGEAANSVLFDELVNTSFNLWHVYGPTETTIWSTLNKVSKGDLSLSIGRPIDNTSCVVLNNYQQIMPPELIGELYIGGLGVANGYLNYSNENFVKLNYFDDEKYYKTGDLVYWKNDKLFYSSRNDRQIKLRGYRIDPSEIESSLLLEENIIQSHVAHIEEELVAFCVVKEESHINLDFSLFYFSATQSNYKNAYEFIFESAMAAEKAGIEAVWIPERHFDPTGALFPNPAILAASIASKTSEIKIRAGSVILPLNNPIRIAEDWAMVDNLSDGRAGVAFASGWHPNDFILAPEKFDNRKNILIDGIEEVRKIWQGEKTLKKNGLQKNAEIKIFPEPVQNQIPIWITAAGSDETFELAGKSGANLLTHFLIQDSQALKNKIKIYHQALESVGINPESRTVTVMLHTFIADTDEEAKSTAAGPFKNYLLNHFSLLEKVQSDSTEDILEINDHIENAYHKFIDEHSLIGSLSHCLSIVKNLLSMGVNEFACLIDFGIEEKKVLNGIGLIKTLQEEAYKTKIHTLDEKRLQNKLNQYLPEYMVPHKFIPIEKMPLTENSKVDEKALINLLGNYKKKISSLSKQEISFHQEPSTTENKLIKIWEEILNQNNINLNSNFFSLGGHSLKAIQVLNKIEESFGVKLSLRQFFKIPTIRQIAFEIEKPLFNQTENIKENCLLQKNNSYSIPISHLQAGIWFMHQMQSDSPRYNDSFSICFDGKIDFEKMHSALLQTANNHPILKSRIINDENLLLEINAVHLSLELIETHFLNTKDENLIQLMKRESAKPFDLKEKLARFLLIRTKYSDILVISFHHIVTDGTSFEIFIKELFYNYQNDNNLNSYPQPEIEYKNYLLEEKLSEEVHQKLLSQWKSDFQYEPLVKFNLGQVRPDKQSYKGKMKNLSFSNSVVSKIESIAKELECSMFSYLQSVLNIVLQIIADNDKVIIGIPYSNRDDAKYKNSIGLFVNLLTTVIPKNRNLSIRFSDLILEVFDDFAKALHYKNLPFSKLVDYLAIKRNLSHHPLCQVVFGMYDLRNFPKKLDQINCNLLQIDYGISRYDIEIQNIINENKLDCILRFNTDIFSEGDIEFICNLYSEIINTTIQSPEMSLKDLLSSLPKSSKMNCDTNFLLEVAERISEIDISSIKRNNQALEVNYSYHENDFKDENLVSSWKSIYNKLYAKNSDEKYPGWVNSITKQKYSFEEMFEWQMQTIEKIKLLQPKTILEIGAGTGILISELLPIAEQYIATDFSNEAIQFLKNKFQEEKFSAHCCSADNINNFVNGKTFNVIILNSIIQYFPSYEYFMDVFENILNFVDEGYIFIGDVKDIACLEKLKRETSGNIQDTPLEAKKNLAMAMLNDAELSFDKNLMSSLVNLFPSIISFDIVNKEGIYQTEMNKYRYDCILKIDKTSKKRPHYFSLSDKQEWCLEAAKIKLKTIFQTLIGKEVNCIFNNTNSKMMPSHSEYDVSTENADDLLKIKFQIQKIWKEILGSKNINYEENFFDLGGDSILSIQMIARLRRADFELTPEDFFRNQNINSLADFLLNKTQIGRKNLPVFQDSHLFSLSPIQAWLLRQNLKNSHHWNQALLIKTHIRKNKLNLEKLMHKIIHVHDSFRLRFKLSSEQTYEQFYYNGSPEEFKVHEYDLSDISTTSIKERISKETRRLQSSLNIHSGPLFQCAVFNTHEEQFVLFIFHGLIMDGVSWRIFLDDLAYLWEGKKTLSKQRSTYKNWIELMQRHVSSNMLQSSKEFWLDQNIPSNFIFQEISDLTCYSRIKTKELQIEKVKIDNVLNKLNVSSNRIESLLLLLLCSALSKQYLEENIFLSIESHGRRLKYSSLDLSNIIGWFTSIYDVSFSINKHDDLNSRFNKINYVLENAKEHSENYMVLQEYDVEFKQQVSNRPIPKILFNYFGRFEHFGPEHPCFEVLINEAKYLQDDGNLNLYPLHVNAAFINDYFQIEFRYSQDVFNEDEINRLVDGFLSYLNTICEGQNKTTKIAIIEAQV